MRFLSIIFILYSCIFANTINESLLNIHATIVPKLPLMDYKYKQKLNNNSISIIIYYDEIEYNNAKKLKEKIDLKYPNGLKSHPVEVKLALYSDKSSLKANIYYLFASTKSNIKATLKDAKKNNAMTFSYSVEALSYGCMISLNIGAKVKPIINLHAIKANDISIRPVLIDISDIYEQAYSHIYLLNFFKKKNAA